MLFDPCGKGVPQAGAIIVPQAFFGRIFAEALNRNHIALAVGLRASLG